MKKLIFIVIAAAIAIAIPACSSSKDAAATAREKAMNAKLDSLRAVEAMNAFKSGKFIIAVSRITFKHGGTFQPNPTLNFISCDAESGSIQLASPSAPGPGANGLGGITLDGSIRNASFKTDKKGNATYNYILSGMGLSAEVTVRLSKGATRATASVDASYSTDGMMVEGALSPLNGQQVVRGSSLIP